jgi:hypothetical protein
MCDPLEVADRLGTQRRFDQGGQLLLAETALFAVRTQQVLQRSAIVTLG